jgi:hypothetical protein
MTAHLSRLGAFLVMLAVAVALGGLAGALS